MNNSEEQSFTDFKLEEIKSSSNTKFNLPAVRKNKKKKISL
jgi:hypothetical protein